MLDKESREAQARDTFATFFSKAKRDRYPSIGAEDDDAPDAKRTRSSSVGAENDDAPEEAHVPRYPTLLAPPRAAHTLEVARHLTPSCVSFVRSAKPTAARVGQLHPLGILACKLLKVSRALRYSLSAVRCLAAALFPSSNNMRVCVNIFFFCLFLLLAVFL